MRKSQPFGSDDHHHDSGMMVWFPVLAEPYCLPYLSLLPILLGPLEHLRGSVFGAADI